MGKKRFKETDEFYAERALAVLAGELDVRMDALLPLARHLGIVPDVAGPWKLEAEQELKLRACVEGLVPSTEVSWLLGLESWEWQGLAERRILTGFSCFALGRMYLRSEVEGLVAALFAKATAPQATSVSLRTYARRHGLSVADVVMLAVDGRIAVVRVDGDQPGLRTLRVVAGNRRMLKARAASNAEVVTVTEAATTLALTGEDVCRLVDVGVLEKMAGGIPSRSVKEFRKRYANAKLYCPELGCANIEAGDRLAAIGVSACFDLSGANVVVEREKARRALRLQFDPDDQRIVGHALWDQFRELVHVRCPVFIIPLTVREVGAKIRTATRKVAVDVALDRAAGSITLGFNLHPLTTGRRWKLFERREAEVRKSLDLMDWDRSPDGLGWRLSYVARGADDLLQAVDAMTGMHRLFK